MPKKLGECLFITGIGFFVILASTNQIVAILCLISSLVLGYQEGFGTATIVMSFLFSFLLVGDLISLSNSKPEKILKSLWPNLLVVIIRLVYLFFAGLLFYGLFWEGGLTKYYWTYLGVAVALTLVNLPWMIFHLTLCFPKYRQRMSKIDAELRPKPAD